MTDENWIITKQPDGSIRLDNYPSGASWLNRAMGFFASQFGGRPFVIEVDHSDGCPRFGRTGIRGCTCATYTVRATQEAA